MGVDSMFSLISIDMKLEEGYDKVSSFLFEEKQKQQKKNHS